MELDSEPSSVTDYGSVADFDSATGSDSAIEERSHPSILRIVMGNS